MLLKLESKVTDRFVPINSQMISFLVIDDQFC
jgi:hypothetical protein